MIWYVPVEPLEERYTASWFKNIPTFFESKGAEVNVINGQVLTHSVEVGTFLDINSTVYYKSNQLGNIAYMFNKKIVRPGDIFFFGDAEFWGLESVRLMSQMNNVPVKIFAFLHAASYTTEDAFSVAESYQKFTELGWLASCDGIFVGSTYHKQAVFSRRLQKYAGRDASWIIKRIHVTGNPLFESDYPLMKLNTPKQKQLIICNRFDYEKRPNLSLDFAYILKRRHPDLRIIITTSRPKFTSNRKWLVEYARKLEQDGIVEIYSDLSKYAYLEYLAQSKVMLSNTIEENFGYTVVEACLHGTVPIVPNDFSHPELLEGHEFCLYDSEDEIVEKVETVLAGKVTVPPHASTFRDSLAWCGAKYFKSMDKIWEEMQGKYNNG